MTRRGRELARPPACPDRGTRARLRDYGGWGIRKGRSGWAYNVSGDRGVRLTYTDGETLLIGSQRADELAKAIEVARVSSRPRD
jgi:hypothetical protein